MPDHNKNKPRSLVSFIHDNAGRLNGHAKYFSVEGDFKSIIIDHRITVENKLENAVTEPYGEIELDYTPSFMRIIRHEMSSDINEYRGEFKDMVAHSLFHINGPVAQEPKENSGANP